MNYPRRLIVVIIIVALVGVAATASLYALTLGKTSSSSNNGYPPGCSRPPNGYLVIASNLGWNDSELKGAGVTAGVVWPKITVAQGSTVDITVCNIDVQTHSFNVATYLSSQPNYVAPQQVLRFSFVASHTGTFQIYCLVPCSIHIYMLSGEIVVTPR